MSGAWLLTTAPLITKLHATATHGGGCSGLQPRYPRLPRARALPAGGGAGRPPPQSGPRAAPGGQPPPRRAPSSGAPPPHRQARSLRCTALALRSRLSGPPCASSLLALRGALWLWSRLPHPGGRRRRGLLGAV